MSIRNIALFLCCSFVLFSGFKKLEDCTPITSSQLRTMLVQLGYDVKDLNLNPGKEKYVITIASGGLDVPIGAELSASTKYIWLTVNLSSADSTNGAKNYSLLKQNGIAQPAQFYVTSKGVLMMGLPIENKGVTNYVLREKLEFLAVKVSNAKSIWQ
jgi:hypothetical protein